MTNAIILTGTQTTAIVGMLGEVAIIEMLMDLTNEGRRVYPDNLIAIKDEGLFQTVASLGTIGKTVGVGHPLYKTILKSATDYIRSNTGTDCVISLAIDIPSGTVLAYEYESIEATEGGFYESGFDNQLNVPYIIL